VEAAETFGLSGRLLWCHAEEETMSVRGSLVGRSVGEARGGGGRAGARSGLLCAVAHPAGALRAVLAVVVVALAALACVPAAHAAAWPQYTDPTDTHETNNAWYPFKDTGGTAVGDSLDWVANAPTDLTDELSVALGMANYGTTDVFFAGSGGVLLMRPWDLTTVPNAPTSSISAADATQVVPAQSGGVGYVGVCEIGGTQPDVIVFYCKGDPTVAASRTTLYWRAISDDWIGENSVTMPSDFLAGSSWDQVPGAGSTWFLHGTVVALNNAFAFVSMSSGEVDTYVSNLLAPGASGAIDKATAWTPTTVSGQQVRDVDAIPFTYQGSTYLALGGLYGTPTTNSDWHWGTIVKQWNAMQAAVRVCSVEDDGSCAVASSTSFAVTACPDQGPSNNTSGLKMQSGALNLRLARGGVTDGALGDVLTVMTRTFGTLDRMLINDNTHGVVNHYDTDEPELLDAFEVTVDHSQDVPGLGSSPQRYSGWRRRGLMSDGSDDLESTKTVYQLIGAQGLVSRGFFVTTVAMDDPNGPTNPSGITASPSPLVYGSSRQRIVWATATQLQAQGVNVVDLDDLNAYTGVVGAVGYLDSDTLQPVKTDTTDQDGDVLSSPITYPYSIPADSSDLQLIGIIYGTPPMSLNGNAQADIFPINPFGLNYYSSVLFAQENVAGTTTVDETEGSAGLALDLGGEGEHGLKFPFEPEVSWQTEQEDVASNSVTVENSQSFFPLPSGTPCGVGLFKQISDFQLQRYARRDWEGGDIGTDGVDESVFVTNPVSTGDVINGCEEKTFDLDDPDSADSDPLFAGMAGRKDTFDPAAWLGVDPLADTEHVALFDAKPDGSGGSTEVSLSRTSDEGGSAEATFSTDSTTQNDVVSNSVAAKLKIPFFSSDYSMVHKVYDTTTTTNKTEVWLGLPSAPSGEQAGSVKSITVQAYWLRANDDEAYWIPTAFRTGGTYATPWCIDYQVMEYELYPDSAAAAQSQCRVALLSSPSNGGTARSMNQERMASGALLGTADADGELIKADPAPGFRFVGWKLHDGGIARLRNGDSRLARVSATGLGGVTAVARFARIAPRRVRIVRQGRDSWGVALERAPLGEPLSDLLPWLDGTAADDAQPLRLCVGSDAYAVPAPAWKRAVRDGHVLYTTRWRPRGWSKGAGVQLTVDATSRRWSLALSHGRVSQAMLSVAGGGLPLRLVCSGQAAQPAVPVACSATFKAAPTRPAGIVQGARAAGGAVDLRRATVATIVDARTPRTARFALAGVQLRPDLFRRSGMELAVNGTAVHVGRFVEDGTSYVATTRAAGGARGECRYTAAGTLSLTLTGGDLFDRLSAEFVVQNVVLTVGSGPDAPSGAMAPVPTSVTGARLAPANGGLAL
jgi:hypothetical protein